MTFVKSSKYMFLKKIFLNDFLLQNKLNFSSFFAMYFRSRVIILLWKLSSCLFKAFQEKKKTGKGKLCYLTEF